MTVAWLQFALTVIDQLLLMLNVLYWNQWFHEEPLASVYLFTKGSLYWEKVLPTLIKLKVPKAIFAVMSTILGSSKNRSVKSHV